jgi:hypothetical protein
MTTTHPRRPPWRSRTPPQTIRRLETTAALAACTAAALLISAKLLRPDVLSYDALVHQYWMWQWRDPQLFTDGLTAALRESARYPDGYEALFRVGTLFAEPIAFGEWVGVALMALSAWLVFLIVREHTSWRPGAWIAAALFLALMDIHRFHGGFPRAFVHPVVLLTVLLALRRRSLAAALVAAGGALLYPPAALLAVGVLIVACLEWSGRRPRIDRRRTAFAALALALAAAAVLGPRIASGGAPDVFTAAQARQFPEFGPQGTLRFFASSPLEYLRQNRSGFDLDASGSILALAAVALLLLLRRTGLRLIRPEVLALPVVALGAWAVAQAMLFELYLPHRYTYPLVAFFAIVVGVMLRPTWTALWARRRPGLRAFALLAGPLAVAALAVHAFPLGPLEPLDRLAETSTLPTAAAARAAAAGTAALLRRAGGTVGPSAGAALTGLALLAVLLVVPDHHARGSSCRPSPASAYLATLPKDAVIAGDPNDLKCLPATARRAVVISTQLAPAYEIDYFLGGRARMFAMLRAYYGPSRDAIADLRSRYGATHLWVRRGAVRREREPGGARWRSGKLPYGRFVRRLLSAGEPAVLRLPAPCRRWRHGAEEVYDVACLAAGTQAAAASGTGAQAPAMRSGRFVMTPSTPSSSRRCASAGSSTVHGRTARPRAWAASTRPASTTPCHGPMPVANEGTASTSMAARSVRR